MTLVLAGLGLVFSGGALAALAKGNAGRLISTITTLASFLLLLPPIYSVLTGGETRQMVLQWSEPAGMVRFVIDPLAAFFMFIIALGGWLSAFYSMDYMRAYREDAQGLSAYYFFLHLLIASMLVLVIVQNAFVFLVAWELMSLASFFLVSFENGKEEVRKAGLYYLVAMQAGAAFLIAAFAFMSFKAGSMDFARFSEVFHQDAGLSLWMFLLFFVGFGAKAGFFPLHTWLPLAHPAAPSPVSAILSGVMIKTGIYGLLRILLLMGPPEKGLAMMVFLVSLVSGLFGVMNAIAQRDIKKLLAYSSIENIGIIGMGIGLGMLGQAYGQPGLTVLGFSGALLHVFNHFTFKSVLFYGAGVVYARVHTRNIEDLGGLIRFMPWTATLFLIASLAISGLPALNGFVGEFALYYGMATGLLSASPGVILLSLVGIAGLAFIGVMAVLCFTNVFGVSFLGVNRRPFAHAPGEASGWMLLPMGLLSVLIVLIGLYPPITFPFLQQVVGSLAGEAAPALRTELGVLYAPVVRAIGLFALILLGLFLLRSWMLRNKRIAVFKTWDCGYQAPGSRFQYTASSFAAPFLSLTRAVLPVTRRLLRPQGLFPEDASFESRPRDLADVVLFSPLLGLLRKFFGLFTWIQSGKTQRYILYGLVFLLLVIIWIVGGG